MNALAEAKKRFKSHPDVVSISWGMKKSKGVFTGAHGVVFGVRKKDKNVPASRMLPGRVKGELTDVAERKRIDALSLITRRRPAPPGYSVGHVEITAGTIACYVKDKDGKPLLLSNNHVLANSNNALIGDAILQPGAYDDGFSENDTIGRLKRFVAVNFEGSGVDSGSLCEVFRMILDVLCPQSKKKKRGIKQPSPNLVDCGVAELLNPEWATNDAPIVGELKGFGTVWLEDFVQCVSRTTGHTVGRVVGENALVQVGFGEAGVAFFDDQLEIEGTEGVFSEPGDSGGAILDGDNRVCGLLFAGGDNITIANQIGNVVSLLGVVW